MSKKDGKASALRKKRIKEIAFELLGENGYFPNATAIYNRFGKNVYPGNKDQIGQDWKEISSTIAAVYQRKQKFDLNGEMIDIPDEAMEYAIRSYYAIQLDQEIKFKKLEEEVSIELKKTIHELSESKHEIDKLESSLSDKKAIMDIREEQIQQYKEKINHQETDLKSVLEKVNHVEEGNDNLINKLIDVENRLVNDGLIDKKTIMALTDEIKKLTDKKSRSFGL